jgi:hypothetical protein
MDQIDLHNGQGLGSSAATDPWVSDGSELNMQIHSFAQVHTRTHASAHVNARARARVDTHMASCHHTTLFPPAFLLLVRTPTDQPMVVSFASLFQTPSNRPERCEPRTPSATICRFRCKYYAVPPEILSHLVHRLRSHAAPPKQMPQTKPQPSQLTIFLQQGTTLGEV